MTTKQLIKKLQELPENLEVMLIQTDDEYSTSGVNTVEVRKIIFQAHDIPKREWAKEDCVVISDEI